MTSDLDVCPHCGELLTPPKYTYAIKSWATPVFVFIISVMLILLDLSVNGEITWSLWGVLGVLVVYIPVQLLRSNPHYGWIIIPIGGILASIFLLYLDRLTGPNSGPLGYDWALTAIIPIIVFIVCFPIIARFARDQPTQINRLRWFIEELEKDE